MNICEAVKAAMKQGCKISKSFGDDGSEIIIEPTNELDCCKVALKMPNGEIRPAHKMWNPMAKDLIATDWKLTF